MTREETKNLLITIQSVYPNYKPQDKTIAVNAWNMFLEDYPCQLVLMAFKAYVTVDTTGFAPSIGQIIDKIHTISNPYELNEMEAWALVSRAVGRSALYAAEEFTKLPPLVQKAVGAPSNLENWAKSDYKSLETVIQSNFKNTYNAVVAREREISKMPKDVKSIIDNVNKGSYSAELEYQNTKYIETSHKQQKEENKTFNSNGQCVPMPEYIKSKFNI